MTTAEDRSTHGATRTTDQKGLRISHEHVSEDMTVVTLSGPADVFTAPFLRTAIKDILDLGRSLLVIDVTDVELVDSTALGVFIGALKRTRLHDGGVGFVHAAGSPVLHILRVAGFSRVFPVFMSVTDAEEQLPHLFAAPAHPSRRGGPAPGTPTEHAAAPDDVHVAELPPGPLRISHGQLSCGPTLVTVAGLLDAAASPRLQNVLFQLVEDGHDQILIDMGEVIRCHGAGFGVLVGALKRAHATRGRIGIVSPSAQVRQDFRTCRLDRVFPLYASLAEGTEDLPRLVAEGRATQQGAQTGPAGPTQQDGPTQPPPTGHASTSGHAQQDGPASSSGRVRPGGPASSSVRMQPGGPASSSGHAQPGGGAKLGGGEGLGGHAKPSGGKGLGGGERPERQEPPDANSPVRRTA